MTRGTAGFACPALGDGRFGSCQHVDERRWHCSCRLRKGRLGSRRIENAPPAAADCYCYCCCGLGMMEVVTCHTLVWGWLPGGLPFRASMCGRHPTCSARCRCELCLLPNGRGPGAPAALGLPGRCAGRGAGGKAPGAAAPSAAAAGGCSCCWGCGVGSGVDAASAASAHVSGPASAAPSHGRAVCAAAAAAAACSSGLSRRTTSSRRPRLLPRPARTPIPLHLPCSCPYCAAGPRLPAHRPPIRSRLPTRLSRG